MKKLSLGLLSLATLGFAAQASAQNIPVFSANGFLCGKEGQTVTCKGPVPNGKDTMTATGHDLVYLTINSKQEGAPVRYTYFSDTGCLIGYTFNAAGQPAAAVASHRKGAKQTFNFQSTADYDKVIAFCVADAPGTSTASAPSAGSSAKPATAPAMKPAAQADPK